MRGDVDLMPDGFIFYTWRTLQLGKTVDFWAVGKCSKVVCTASCWHKKIVPGLLVASA